MMENNFQIDSASVSDRGLSEKRPQNEDSFLEMSELGLFAVADGVGGAQAGDVASQMAMEILGEAFINMPPNCDAEDVMKIAIERANGAIFQMSHDLPQLSTMATTIVALHVAGNIATIGHVGDSRLYRLDGKGNLYRETQDHSVVEEEVRAGRMTAAQAANHPSRNVISRALGAESTVEVDMKTIMFEPNTSFLLCSDGITRHIDDFEIRELLGSKKSPNEICERMKTLCYERGAEDNLTAVIVKILGAEAEMSEVPPTTQLSEIEEATVAAARSATAESSFADVANYDSDIPTTRNLVMPDSMQSEPSAETPQTQQFADSDEDYLIQESESQAETMAGDEPNIAVPQAAESVDSMSFPAQESDDKGFAETPTENTVRENQYNDYSTEPKSSGGGFIGKLLASIILLFVGAILGVAGYYAWQNFVALKPETPILKPQTNNIPNNSTENLRADADRKPLEVIKRLEETPQKDSSDYYILGRAFLANGKYKEATGAFIQARNLLKDVTDADTKTVLATDIAQGLVISQNENEQKMFEKERKLADGSEINSINSNSAGNSNQSETSPSAGEPKTENRF